MPSKFRGSEPPLVTYLMVIWGVITSFHTRINITKDVGLSENRIALHPLLNLDLAVCEQIPPFRNTRPNNLAQNHSIHMKYHEKWYPMNIPIKRPTLTTLKCSNRSVYVPLHPGPFQLSAEKLGTFFRVPASPLPFISLAVRDFLFANGSFQFVLGHESKN